MKDDTKQEDKLDMLKIHIGNLSSKQSVCIEPKLLCLQVNKNMNETPITLTSNPRSRHHKKNNNTFLLGVLPGTNISFSTALEKPF